MKTLEDLRQALAAFAAERDWAQYHAPKNLAMSVSIEAGELLEHFQWLTEAESDALTPERRQEVASEIADVLLYLVQLADRLGIDPMAAAEAKMKLNAQRFPPGAAGRIGKHEHS